MAQILIFFFCPFNLCKISVCKLIPSTFKSHYLCRECSKYLLKLESTSANSAAISPDHLSVCMCVYTYNET